MVRIGAGILAVAMATSGCARGDAEDLRDEIEADDYRGSWARAPGWDAPRLPSDGGPHGAFVDIYVNDVIEDAIADGEPLEAWPEGSIIAKDGWTDAEGGSLRYLAVMERRDGGWFWAEWDRGTRLEFAGVDERTCTGCHGAGQDEVRAFDLP